MKEDICKNGEYSNMVIFKVPNCAIALFTKVHIYSLEYYHRRIYIIQNMLGKCGMKGCYHKK